MRIHYAGICEAGSRREENQDRVFCAAKGEAGLFLVADGMGGHLAGAFASDCIRLEAEKTWKAYEKEFGEDRAAFLDEVCEAVLETANDRIRSCTPPGEVCGSTAVLLRIGAAEVRVISCGDSRCYLVRRNLLRYRLHRLTRDDVWENRPENTEKLTKKEIMTHKNRGKLIRTVGAELKFSCSAESFRLQRGDLYVLCSDGVYKYMEPALFSKILLKTAKKGREGLREGLERIKEEVYRAGAPDNLSLVLVTVEKTGSGKKKR